MSSERSFARLPGFRDFVPEDFAVREHVFQSWRRVSRRYGFMEYDGPPLEPLDLYVEKSGPEIVGQLYNFVDKGGREVTLRPEMTPTLARVLADKSKGMAKPIRWFTCPQLFRYERQQRGRLKEHFQLNVDIVGEASPAADAEVLAVAIDVLRDLGLGAEDFAARVNDRRLVTAVLEAIGIGDDHKTDALAAIDKWGRMPVEKTRRLLHEAGVASPAVDRLQEILADPSWDAIEGRFRDMAAVREAMAPLSEHRRILEEMGLGAYVVFDFTIVRGLAYYTGIVFELFDRAGELRAICGGGRYDRLLELVGGEPLPAVGFGMGDVVLTELLKDRTLLPVAPSAADLYLIWVDENQRALAMEWAHRWREAGVRVLYGLRSQGVSKQLKAATRAGASRAVIIGPDEAEKNSATVRDLDSGSEEVHALADVPSALAS
ncbi:MAG: histidine--tRNA ligase [Gemmatimonadetes bacterium]|nr:histidine--tRNA ligase [Gemmatimonadota bacterium]